MSKFIKVVCLSILSSCIFVGLGVFIYGFVVKEEEFAILGFTIIWVSIVSFALLFIIYQLWKLVLEDF